MILDKMSTRLSSTVSRVCDYPSERMQAYRFFNNDAISVKELISVCSCLNDHCFAERDILVPIDETAVSVTCSDRRFDSFSDDAHRWVGVVGDNKSAGFFLFAGLALDEHSGLCYGLTDIVHHCIPRVSTCKEANIERRIKRRGLAFEQVSSSAWPLLASNTHQQLRHARRVTYIMDRGSDCYAAFVRILEIERAEVILRLKYDRSAIHTTTGQEGRLGELLNATEWQSDKEVFLPKLDHYSKSTGKRKQRSARQTRLQLRYIPVQISPTSTHEEEEPTLTRPLYLIEVAESPEAVPATEKPLHWRLLTSRAVTNCEQAWYIIQLYLKRWLIEQLFRIFKKQGLDIESTQFKAPQAITKQAIMAMSAAAKVIQLDQVKKASEPIPIEIVFEEQEQQVLKEILPELEGRTQKQKNPYQPDDLRWAAWIIARLGGWAGYASQRSPGPLSFKRGLERFETIVWTMKLARKKHEK